LQFVKMHGAGNDFVLLDLFSAPSGRSDEEWAALARSMCDRHFGIGSDGLLLVLRSAVADARMRMFNPDGSESASCGNGIRCLGRFLSDRYGIGAEGLRVETGAGISGITVGDDGMVTVDMGPPIFAPSDIPAAIDGPDALDVLLSVDGEPLAVSCVSMGNPHAVTFVDPGRLENYPLETIGPKVEHDSLFPQRANFEVCEVLDDRTMRVRVWERGAGITLACGTGACAAAVVATTSGRVRPPVSVELPGGVLSIDWQAGGPVMMTGPTAYVFAGGWSDPSAPVPEPAMAAAAPRAAAEPVGSVR
jgi:diaminopimelate epimerase